MNNFVPTHEEEKKETTTDNSTQAGNINNTENLPLPDFHEASAAPVQKSHEPNSVATELPHFQNNQSPQNFNGANQNLIPPVSTNPPPYAPPGNANSFNSYNPIYPAGQPQGFQQRGNPVPYPSNNAGQPPLPYSTPYNQPPFRRQPASFPGYGVPQPPRSVQQGSPVPFSAHESFSPPQPPSRPVTGYTPPVAGQQGNPVPFSSQQTSTSPNPYIYPSPATTAKKDSDFEQALGGKITSIVGIFFILLAVVFGLYYTYTILESDLIKTIIAYAVGVVFLVVGELFGRKSKSGRGYFSLGLCAGGVAILFATTAISYFELEVLSVVGAIIACSIAFLLAIYLALRHNSQLIGIFAVIGGYIPILVIDTTISAAVACMIYFFIINLLVLFLAQKKNWNVIKYFALIFSIVFCNYLADQTNYSPVPLIGGYIILTSLLFLAITLIRPLKLREKLTINERILVVINAIFFLLTMNDVITLGLSHNYDWVAPLFFALLYFAIFFLFKSSIKEDKPSHLLFLILSLCFLLISTSSRLDSTTQSAVMVMVGILLLLFAVLKSDSQSKIAGGILTGISLAFFYSHHSTIFLPSFDGYLKSWKQSLSLKFIIMFLIISLGLVLVILALKFKNKATKNYLSQPHSNLVEFFKALTFVNTWLFLIALSSFALKNLPDTLFAFWVAFVCCFVSILLLLLVLKTGVVSSLPMKIAAFIPALYGLSVLITRINFGRIVKVYPQNPSIKFSAIAAVCLVNIFAVYALYALMNSMIKNPTNKSRFIPLTVSIVSLVLAYSICRHHILGKASVILSILVLVWALAMVVYGFIKNVKTIRITGLALSAAAVFKIFVLDLFYVHGWQRALSYGIIGILFISISFAYQHFSAKLLPKKVGAPIGSEAAGTASQPFSETPNNSVLFDETPNKLITIAPLEKDSQAIPDSERFEKASSTSDSELEASDPEPELNEEDKLIIQSIEDTDIEDIPQKLGHIVDSLETPANPTQEITKED